MAFKYRGADANRVTDQNGVYFITTTVVEWIDVFTRRQLADVIVESLKYCQKEKGLVIYAWCLMPNHLHMIVSAEKGVGLSDIMRDFKKFTSKKVILTIQRINESRDWMMDKFEFAARIDFKGKTYKFWQDGFHPIRLEDESLIKQKLKYIHQNPVKAGLVIEASYYNYSSAINYEGGFGLLGLANVFLALKLS